MASVVVFELHRTYIRSFYSFIGQCFLVVQGNVYDLEGKLDFERDQWTELYEK
jgi:hypothetical protein